MIDQIKVKELFSYNKVTGIFSWNESRGCVKKGTVAGCLGSDGYLRVKIDGSAFLLHRVAYLYINGSMPANEIDHINGNRSDNRIQNLRDVTCSVNKMNKCMQSNNSSGITGVSWILGRKKWRSVIYVDNKVVYLAHFDSLLDACCRYMSERQKYEFTYRHGK